MVLRAEVGLRVLVLSFYYPPDLSAGSFRASAFVEALKKHIGASGKIEVLTSAPNRYHSFQQTALDHESSGNLTITRIPVPRHRSGMLGQSVTFARFAWGAWRQSTGQNYNVIWATSSRLFTAFLGALLSRRIGAPLYLDIRDIFTEVIKDILRNPMLRPLWIILRYIERFTLTRASRISLVSEAFKEHIMEVAGDKPYIFLPNGIDKEFIGESYEKTKQSKALRILYAGNIGEGQGLHQIIPQCARELGEAFEFWVVGDGGAREKLNIAISQNGAKNVRIMAPVDRRALIDLYAQSDYLFLHLNNYDAFRKVLPSKIFEYAATGKPIIAGVDGYARAFIRENIENAAVFRPCDVRGFVDAMRSLKEKTIPRSDFVQRFRRTDLMDRMVADVMKCV